MPLPSGWLAGAGHFFLFRVSHVSVLLKARESGGLMPPDARRRPCPEGGEDNVSFFGKSGTKYSQRDAR